VHSLTRLGRRREYLAMTEHASIRSISGDTEVAGTPSIVAPGALYAMAFGHRHSNRLHSFCRLRRQTDFGEDD
jgi:hypothetical protein